MIRPLKQKQSGFTLIELLLVIGFIAGALVLAFVTFPKVQASSRANTEGTHITTIVAGIKNLYSTAQSYSTVSNSVLLSAKIFPDDMQVSGSNVSNVWGGNVTVAPTLGASGVGSNLAFTITYTDVPQNECNKLATGVATNYLKEVVNSAIVMDKTTTNVSIDPGLVAGNCANQNNTIVITAN